MIHFTHQQLGHNISENNIQGDVVSHETITKRVIDSWAIDDDTVFCHFLDQGSVRSFSRREFLLRANSFAQAYSQHGVKPGHIVIILLGHHFDAYCSFAAALLIGAIPSFLPLPSAKQDPEIYWETHTKLLRRIDARALVTHKASMEGRQISNFPATAVIHIEDVLPQEMTVGALAVGEGDKIAFLQHSSGTTGLNKGVALSHRTVLKNIDTYARMIDLQATDKIISWLPLYHDMGLITGFIMPMVHGIPFVSMDPFEWVMRPTLLLETLESYQGTIAWMPNFAFHHIVNAAMPDDQWDLSSVRALINCSEPCKPQTMEEFNKRFSSMGLARTALQSCYAMAENVFAVTQSALSTPPRTEERDGTIRLSCGRPMAGVEIRIVGNDGLVLADGRVGEILIRTNTLFNGYFNLPRESDEALTDGWLHTGDLGYLSQGELFVTGRTKDVLIVRGTNYYAHDVEYAANGVDGVIPGRCIAVSTYDETAASEEVILIAETEVSETARLKEIKKEIKKQVFSHLALIIKSVEFVPKGWLIKTTSGKIARSRNASKYFEKQER